MTVTDLEISLEEILDAKLPCIECDEVAEWLCTHKDAEPKCTRYYCPKHKEMVLTWFGSASQLKAIAVIQCNRCDQVVFTKDLIFREI